MKNELTAKRLVLALSNANMKPQELADKAGVNKASISQYVNGSHAPSNISSGKMASVLNVNPLWLMGFDVPMNDVKPMMGIGYRIKEARERLGLTQTELGQKVGVTGSAITNYEKETSHPKEQIIYKLMETLGVDANYLFQDCVNIPKELNNVTLAEFEYIQKYRELDSHGKEIVDYILLKEWERVDALKSSPAAAELDNTFRLVNYYYRLASAGTGQILFDTPPTKRIEIPNIQKYAHVDYAIGVNGNSMEPMYHDGDTLLVEMTDEISVGSIGIFCVDDNCYVKKLGNAELISLNADYPNIPLNETARCMGRVIDKLAR